MQLHLRIPREIHRANVTLTIALFIPNLPAQIFLLLYAGLGLPQGPFSENSPFPLKVGLRWAFVNGLKWVQKWVLGAKMGEKWVFSPSLDPFRDFHKNPLFSQFKGVEVVF